MGCEDERGFAIAAQLPKSCLRIWWVFDKRPRLPFLAAQAIKMREFGADTPKIVPYAAEDGFDFRRRLLRKRGAQAVATDAIFAQVWTDAAQQSRPCIADFHAIEMTDRGQQQGEKPTGNGVGSGFETDNDPPAKTSQRRLHFSFVATVRSSRCRARMTMLRISDSILPSAQGSFLYPHFYS
jgi:hypothetical protein